MAQEVKRSVIHKWAAASAATAGALPVGAALAALFGEEILMVIHVALQRLQLPHALLIR